MTHQLRAVSVCAGVLLLSTACGSTAPKPAATPTPSATPTPVALPVPTRAQVTAAMLTAGDVGAGFTQSPPSGNPKVTGTGPDPTCADLVKISFSDMLPGSLFEVDRQFDNGSGTSISQSVAPYATATSATAMVRRIAADAAGCRSIAATVGGTTLTFTITVGARPAAGTAGNTIIMTGTGQFTGLVQYSTTVVQGSTVLGITAPTAAQADLLTTRALAKLTKQLSGSAS